MTKIRIDPETLEMLNEIAKRENRSVQEIIESAMSQYLDTHPYLSSETPVEQDPPPAKDSLLLIAQATDELGETSGQGNISERSRELLNTTRPDELMRRLREQDQ